MKLVLILMTLSHLFADLYAGFLTPLIPALMERFTLDTAQITWLVSLTGFLTSFSQPIFGILSDRTDPFKFVFFCLLLVFLSSPLIGVVPTFSFLVVVLMISRFSNSAFHPSASGIMGTFSDSAFKMAIFSVGGAVGSALAPIGITAIVSSAGLNSTWMLIFPGLILLMAYSFTVRHHLRLPATQKQRKVFPGRQSLKKLRTIWMIVSLRSLVMTLLNTYAPIYLVSVKGKSLVESGILLTIGLLAGSLGNMLGGILYNKYSFKTTNFIHFVAVIPAIFLFVFTDNYLLLLASFAMMDFFLHLTMGTNIVAAQSLLPNDRAIASSIAMGFSWGTGTLLFMIYAPLSNYLDIRTSFLTTVPILVLGAVITLFSKEKPKEEALKNKKL